MFRWSAVFFIWAIVAVAIALRGWGAVATDASWLFSLIFALLFVFFAFLGLASPRLAHARIRP